MTIRITNQRQFENTLKKAAVNLHVDLKDVVQKTAFDLFRGVVERTPVDTGWARSSWNISFGSMDLSIPPKIEGGEAAANNANEKEQQKVEFYPDDFPVVWITNALPYIVPLEKGHSKQMGKGFMVQRTVAQVVADLEAAFAAGLDV